MSTENENENAENPENTPGWVHRGNPANYAMDLLLELWEMGVISEAEYSQLWDRAAALAILG